jgi:DNA recombination-dependent growth factor C
MHQFICVKKGELVLPRSMKKHNLQSELHKLKQNEYGEVKRTVAVSYRR